MACSPTPVVSECLNPSLNCMHTAACSSVMTNYCSTDDNCPGPNCVTYKQKWQGDNVTSPCKKFVASNITPQCFSNVYQPVVDGFVRRYFLTDQNKITFPQQGSTVFDPTMNDIISVCQSSPGGCDQVLLQLCNGFTRDNLQANPNEATLCGCFLADSTYNAYTGSFGITKVCDPLCQLQSAVKPVCTTVGSNGCTSNNGCTTEHCQQTICVIDNVTISLLNGSTAGNINFSQACNSCSAGSGGCTCDISDISITAVQSSIKDVNFQQQCGGNVNCFKRDANGIPQPVACSTLEPSTTPTSPSSGVSVLTIGIVIGIIVFIIIIIIIIALLLRRRKEEPSIFKNRQENYVAPPPSFSTSNLPNY